MNTLPFILTCLFFFIGVYLIYKENKPKKTKIDILQLQRDKLKLQNIIKSSYKPDESQIQELKEIESIINNNLK